MYVSAFSKEGLRKQLDYEGYSKKEIDYAIENCNANWNEECVETAQSYLNLKSFSKSELRGQLEYDCYTSKQIEYALDAVGY